MSELLRHAVRKEVRGRRLDSAQDNQRPAPYQLLGVNIGIVPAPLSHPDWLKMKALLEPAARRGGVPVLAPNEAVWAVYDSHLRAAATARLTDAGHGEIILCGGSGAKEWAVPLADMICDWFRAEGMNAARIYGRRGWGRLLKDWKVLGCENGFTAFGKALA